jgi:hypothetical protein
MSTALDIRGIVRIHHLLVLPLLATAGCGGDRYETYFATYADAKNAGALGRDKWLPEFLPVSAIEIREQHDIDTNALWVTFSFGDAFHAPPTCSPSTREATSDNEGPRWWQQAAAALDSPIQFYQCTQATELGGYWARSDCMLWIGPHRAIYSCSPSTLEPKAGSVD